MVIVDYPNLDPGVCFICEMTNQVQYVDTLRSFSPGGVTPLNGRKYVCAHCIAGFADTLGWASPERLWHLEEMLEECRKDIDELTKENVKLSKIAETIQIIKEVNNDGINSNQRKARSVRGS